MATGRHPKTDLTRQFRLPITSTTSRRGHADRSGPLGSSTATTPRPRFAAKEAEEEIWVRVGEIEAAVRAYHEPRVERRARATFFAVTHSHDQACVLWRRPHRRGRGHRGRRVPALDEALGIDRAEILDGKTVLLLQRAAPYADRVVFG